MAWRAGVSLIMDVSDQGTQQEEFAREAALLVRKPEPQLESGRCSYCGEVTPGRWCDVDCAADWQRQQDADKRAGR